MMDMMGGMGLMMLILVLAAAVIIGVAVYLAVRAAGHDGGDRQEARDLLERRLADGEITPDEFYERESVLRDSGRTRSRR